jgi:hypothetical protein
MRFHRSHVFWALFLVSRICCVTHSPGPQKNEFGSAQGLGYGFFIPHTFDQINTVLLHGP